MGNKLEAWFRSSSVLERRKPSVHTRVFISLSRFFYFSLSLSRSFHSSSGIVPCSLFKLFAFFISPSLSLSLLRNTHATSTLEHPRALHPLHGDVHSKIQPFFARPTNGRSLSLIRQRVHHHLFMRSFVQFKISSFPFLRVVSRTISTYHFRYNRADVLQDPFSASFSWLPSCCCFYVLPCLVSVFLLLSQLFQFRPDARVLPVLEHNITFVSLLSNS